MVYGQPMLNSQENSVLLLPQACPPADPGHLWVWSVILTGRGRKRWPRSGKEEDVMAQQVLRGHDGPGQLHMGPLPTRPALGSGAPFQLSPSLTLQV